MNTFIKEFMDLFNSYSDEIPDKRVKNVIFKRFGINSDKIYTLDEIGLFYEITRERVRQIESKTLKNIQELLYGIKLKKITCECSQSLQIEFKRMNEFINSELVCGFGTFKEHFDLEGIEPGWVSFLIELTDANEIEVLNATERLIFSKDIQKNEMVAAIETVFSFLKRKTTYVSYENIVIHIRKENRRLAEKHIKLAVKCLCEANLVDNLVDLYAIAFQLIASVGDMAYRILFERDCPLTRDDLFTEINKRLKEIGNYTAINIRNLDNQMAQNSNIVNIGGKKWAVNTGNNETKYIRSMIIDEFHRAGEPLTKESIVCGVQERYPDIKKQTIISYLSYEDFLYLNSGKLILQEWKGKFANQLREKKKRENNDLQVIAAFEHNKTKKLSKEALWEFVRTNYDGTQYNFFYHLSKKKYLKNDQDIWILKDNYLDIVSHCRGNIMKAIQQNAERILQENSGQMLLADLQKTLVSKCKFAEKTVYAALQEGNKFVKENNEHGNIIIILKKYKANILTKITEDDFISFLIKSKSEEALFDFKQGFLKLSGERKFDENSFEKIMKNTCAMANHGVGKTGRLFIGVSDKTEDSKRIEMLDLISIPEINGFGICGIQRESIILGYDLEKYQNFLLKNIEASLLPHKLKTHLKSNISYINCKGMYILLMELECIDGPSLYNETEMYIRNGPNLKCVKNDSREYAEVFRRCYAKV